tara:strand:+ start:322 stop:594 length:273 start_codon:yes stop_codon:yes gene_type:complete
MKLTDVVSKHGFKPADELGQIDNAKLYVRTHKNGIVELLCVQKIGDVFRIDCIPLIQAQNQLAMVKGYGFHNEIVHKEDCEGYLNLTLAS